MDLDHHGLVVERERPEVVDVLEVLGHADAAEAGGDKRSLLSRLLDEEVEVPEAPEVRSRVPDSSFEALHQDDPAVVGGANSCKQAQCAEGADAGDTLSSNESVRQSAAEISPTSRREVLETVAPEIFEPVGPINEASTARQSCTSRRNVLQPVVQKPVGRTSSNR
jgi:hypothetical protein